MTPSFQGHFFFFISKIMEHHIGFFELLLLEGMQTKVHHIYSLKASRCATCSFFFRRTIESKTGAKVDIAREGSDGYRQP